LISVLLNEDTGNSDETLWMVGWTANNEGYGTHGGTAVSQLVREPR